jgi:hypothetical protein
MVVQPPYDAQNPPQQSAHGSPWEQEAGQASPVPVQFSPQLPEVLQLLPQQTSPSTQVESSLHGQPNPARPVAATGWGTAIRPKPKVAAPSASSPRSVDRRERCMVRLRVHRSKRDGSISTLRLSAARHRIERPMFGTPGRGSGVRAPHAGMSRTLA